MGRGRVELTVVPSLSPLPPHPPPHFRSPKGQSPPSATRLCDWAPGEPGPFTQPLRGASYIHQTLQGRQTPAT